LKIKNLFTQFTTEQISPPNSKIIFRNLSFIPNYNTMSYSSYTREICCNEWLSLPPVTNRKYYITSIK
jgi:hypothetical protein